MKYCKNCEKESDDELIICEYCGDALLLFVDKLAKPFGKCAHVTLPKGFLGKRIRVIERQ